MTTIADPSRSIPSDSGASSEEIEKQLSEWKKEVLAAVRHHSTFGVSSEALTPQPGVSHTRQALVQLHKAIEADGKALYQCCEDQFMEHPVKALGIIAGAAFVLGVYWAR